MAWLHPQADLGIKSNERRAQLGREWSIWSANGPRARQHRPHNMRRLELRAHMPCSHAVEVPRALVGAASDCVACESHPYFGLASGCGTSNITITAGSD